jgi:hypothetical protein
LQAGVAGADYLKILSFPSASSLNVAAGDVWVPGPNGRLVLTSPVAHSFTSWPFPVNSRLDQIVVDFTGNVSVLYGTDTAGVTISNRTGAQALPPNTVRLHDLVLTNTGLSSATAGWRDRRPFATGVKGAINVFSGIANTTSGGLVQMDPALAIRAEIGSNNNYFSAFLTIVRMFSASGGTLWQWNLDGGLINADYRIPQEDDAVTFHVSSLLSAGSHFLWPGWASIVAGQTTGCSSPFGVYLTFYEFVTLGNSFNGTA